MNIFLSWAGQLSHLHAQAFHDWLPRVIQAASPWLSSESIAKGASWPDDLARGLSESGGVGIFFVTPEALKSQWLLFEAGRISGMGQQRVCIVRIGMERIDPPLGLYQATALNKADVRKLVFDLNKLCQKPVAEGTLEATFEWAWPDLEKKVEELAARNVPGADPAPTKPVAKAAPPSPDLSEKVLGAIDRVEARLGGLEERLANTDRALRSVLVSPIVGSSGVIFSSPPGSSARAFATGSPSLDSVGFDPATNTIFSRASGSVGSSSSPLTAASPSNIGVGSLLGSDPKSGR
ncbi:MAG: toll/interleukin-1 receptor domain-containing protein [Rhizobacter sp.]|nr:toll/interleukin-1 receptor domain-containing protein [Rhizobacter sp.]